MLSTYNRRMNVVILAVIVVIAMLLSILTYYYSVLTSNKILDIASQEVRSNTVMGREDKKKWERKKQEKMKL